ncbi:hypothetical protein BEH94_07730 [Candidatus Altiarchaeales archaeon WOR_SM1_SCG]|nr:hypothetical protein BEH94_07730 [Candidatus Altiarchaeales archaeon WOR_SM1_SCG]
MSNNEPKSIFLDMFGEYPLTKVLDFLLENDIFDHSKTQIAELSGVSFNTLETFWDKLLKFNIIIPARKIGNSQMYILNKKSPLVRKLMEIDKKLMLESIAEPESVAAPIPV